MRKVHRKVNLTHCRDTYRGFYTESYIERGCRTGTQAIQDCARERLKERPKERVVRDAFPLESTFQCMNDRPSTLRFSQIILMGGFMSVVRVTTITFESNDATDTANVYELDYMKKYF